MNNRLIYGALAVIIELLLQILKNKQMPAKIVVRAARLAEDCEAVADGRMNV